MFNKLYMYYKYNGLKATIKTIIKKIFRIKTFGNAQLEKYKNFDLTNEYIKNENVMIKNTKNVYIFATVPYFDVGGGQRSSQLSKIFNRMGFAVYYIYAYECNEENIPIMSIPLVLHQHIENVDKDLFKTKVKKDDLFIFEAPILKFKDFLGIALEKSAKIIYENIDNWETSLGSMFFDKNTLKEMLENADMITSTAKKLVEQTEEYLKEFNIKNKKVYYLANAVDDDMFEPRKEYIKPKDLVTNENTLIYYGSLWGEWFDWDIIKDVANSSAYISINLIGDYSGIKQRVQEMPNNVHFLGLKKQEELPAYLQYSDYAILPFKTGKIGDYVSPLKIFEYISMNKKVLATELPDINGYPNTYTSLKAEEWINYILNFDKETDISARDKFVNENNWYSRCSKMLDVLYPENPWENDSEIYNNISIVVLNYNNKKVIFKCVDTLLLNNERYRYQIVVVDNNSKDGSYELLKEKYSDRITLVKNEKNGCSSGRNLGVKNSTGNYIVFLDSDEWITNKYWLDNYIKLMKENSNIGAIGWGAGWFNKKGYAHMVVDAYEHRYMPTNTICRKDIGYLATCGFIIKKDLFNKVDGFDLNYDPTCYEDTDLSLKVRNAGLEIYYSTYLGVGHLPHQTTKSGTDAHTSLIQRKGEYFINKWEKINKDLIYKYVK